MLLGMRLAAPVRILRNPVIPMFISMGKESAGMDLSAMCITISGNRAAVWMNFVNTKPISIGLSTVRNSTNPESTGPLGPNGIPHGRKPVIRSLITRIGVPGNRNVTIRTGLSGKHGVPGFGINRRMDLRLSAVNARSRQPVQLRNPSSW